jgi:hypothetical protein
VASQLGLKFKTVSDDSVEIFTDENELVGYIEKLKEDWLFSSYYQEWEVDDLLVIVNFMKELK